MVYGSLLWHLQHTSHIWYQSIQFKNIKINIIILFARMSVSIRLVLYVIINLISVFLVKLWNNFTPKIESSILYYFPFFSLQAQAVTLTVAQAFKVALDLWELAQEGEFIE